MKLSVLLTLLVAAAATEATEKTALFEPTAARPEEGLNVTAEQFEAIAPHDAEEDPPFLFSTYEPDSLDRFFRASKTCSDFNKKCTKCVELKVCSYCKKTKTCFANGEVRGCTEKAISGKWKCDDHLKWWGVFLIVICCACICPLISFLCFVYVIKKLCCPKDTEADD